MAASFGERLKVEREKRGMTLEEVSGVTKISVRNLRALEQEKFDQMPGGIFNRGFVRSYAKHLGLDEDQVVADYMDAAGESGPQAEEPEAGVDRPVEAARDGAPQTPWTVLVALLVIGVVLLALWSYKWHRRQPEGAATSPSDAPNQLVPGSGMQVPSLPVSAPEAAQPEPQELAKAVPKDTLSAGSLQAGPASATPASQIHAAASVGAANFGGGSGEVSGFNLSLKARDEVWLSTAVDGQPASEATMEEGQSVNFHALKQVTLKVGNVAGLEFALNGRRVPVNGVRGEVRTLTFTPAGLKTPEPRPN